MQGVASEARFSARLKRLPAVFRQGIRRPAKSLWELVELTGIELVTS
jgi:hypothetical protein